LPIDNGRINPALYTKAAVAIVSKLPKAQDECGRTTYGLAEEHNDWQTVGKIDYQFSARHSIFGRYLAAKANIPHPYTLTGNVLATVSEGFNNFAQSVALGSTYLLDPNTVNAFRIAFNRVAVRRLNVDFFGPTDVGVNGFSALQHNMNVSVSGRANTWSCVPRLLTYSTVWCGTLHRLVLTAILSARLTLRTIRESCSLH
jgi:hypothetical protein